MNQNITISVAGATFTSTATDEPILTIAMCIVVLAVVVKEAAIEWKHGKRETTDQ